MTKFKRHRPTDNRRAWRLARLAKAYAPEGGRA